MHSHRLWCPGHTHPLTSVPPVHPHLAVDMLLGTTTWDPPPARPKQQQRAPSRKRRSPSEGATGHAPHSCWSSPWATPPASATAPVLHPAPQLHMVMRNRRTPCPCLQSPQEASGTVKNVETRALPLAPLRAPVPAPKLPLTGTKFCALRRLRAKCRRGYHNCILRSTPVNR